MPIYNVNVTMKTTMVVVADDEDHAFDVAKEHAAQAFDDADTKPAVSVTGEVTQLGHLRDGWDGVCVPYGGDGNTRLAKLL